MVECVVHHLQNNINGYTIISIHSVFKLGKPSIALPIAIKFGEFTFRQG